MSLFDFKAFIQMRETFEVTTILHEVGKANCNAPRAVTVLPRGKCSFRQNSRAKRKSTVYDSLRNRDSHKGNSLQIRIGVYKSTKPERGGKITMVGSHFWEAINHQHVVASEVAKNACA